METERIDKILFIENGTLVRAVNCDNKTYTGKIYKTDIVLCEDDDNNPHALLFLSQDKRFIEQDGDFGCASLWVEKIKKLEVL